MIVTCKQCGKNFDKTPDQVRLSPNHFCTRSCAASFNNKGRARNPPVERHCKACGSSFYNTARLSTVYCPSCKTSLPDRQDLTLQDVLNRLSVKGKHPSWKWAIVRNFARTWNSELLSRPCANCLYSKHVELAHRRAVSSFPLTTTLREVNAPTNVIQLCRNCHWEFDNGLLVLS